MKKIRQMIFETNSSSTHSLTLINPLPQENFTSKSKHIIIRFINTDDESSLASLDDKVSYLVSQIVDQYKWDSLNYEDLIEQVTDDSDFKTISEYVQMRYGKDIVFPEKYEGCLDEITYINHQIRNSRLTDLLHDIVEEERNLLEEVLENGKRIDFGRD